MIERFVAIWSKRCGSVLARSPISSIFPSSTGWLDLKANYMESVNEWCSYNFSLILPLTQPVSWLSSQILVPHVFVVCIFLKLHLRDLFIREVVFYTRMIEWNVLTFKLTLWSMIKTLDFLAEGESVIVPQVLLDICTVKVTVLYCNDTTEEIL